jgi:hypothetical protein
MSVTSKEIASAGHKLGLLIRDWFEEFFVLPLLSYVAEKLQLSLDHKFIGRIVRFY